MTVPPQPEQCLDHRFFQATGLVMILGTLMAGVITLFIAINMAETEPVKVIANKMDAGPAAFETARKLADTISDVAL